MRFSSRILIITCFVLLLVAGKAEAYTVVFPDPNLEVAIRSAIGKPVGDIDNTELIGLTTLTASYSGIADLTGLEECVDLIYINFWGNSISDISPLSGLSNLQGLLFRDNSISDISALSGLINLQTIGFNSNSISDISALSGLTNLQTIRFYSNSISDISALSGLVNLTDVWLEWNAISDVTALVANCDAGGLGAGDAVYIRNNPLSAQAENVDIPYLQGKGVFVQYGDYTMTTTLTLTAAISTTHTPTPTSSVTSTVTPTATVSATSTISATVTPTQQVVVFPDSGLQAAVRSAIGKPAGDIYKTDLIGLTLLDAHGSGISDLTGLEECSDLASLFLADNSIVDLAPLSGLGNLTYLELSSNSISDLSPLAGLTGLGNLLLDSNSISGLGPLSGLTSLTNLTLSGNSISDATALGSLTTLKGLNLNNNLLANLAALSALTVLTSLSLDDNSVSNVSPLAALTELTSLGLNANSLADISALSGLIKLTQLYLQENSIVDISSLAGLLKLDNLLLRNNSISEVSSLVTNCDASGLEGGDWVDLRGNPLESQALNTDVPYLLSKSINVMYDLPPTPTPTPTVRLSVTVRACPGQEDYLQLRMSSIDASFVDCDSAYFQVYLQASAGVPLSVSAAAGDGKSCWARYYPEPGWRDIDVVYAYARDDEGSWGVSNGSFQREICSEGGAVMRNNKIYPLKNDQPVVVQFNAKGRCRVAVYNQAGEVVAGLLGDGSAAMISLSEGTHQVSWGGESRIGSLVSSGIYTIVVETPDYVKKFKVVVIK